MAAGSESSRHVHIPQVLRDRWGLAEKPTLLQVLGISEKTPDAYRLGFRNRVTDVSQKVMPSLPAESGERAEIVSFMKVVRQLVEERLKSGDSGKQAGNGNGKHKGNGHSPKQQKERVVPAAVAQDARAEEQTVADEQPATESDGAIHVKISKWSALTAAAATAALAVSGLIWKMSGKSDAPVGPETGAKAAPTSQPPKELAHVAQPVPVVPADVQKSATKSEPARQPAVVQKVPDEVKPVEKKVPVNPFHANPVAPIAEATPEPAPEPAPAKPEVAVASLTPSKQPVVPTEGRVSVPITTSTASPDAALPFHSQKKRAVPSAESLVSLRQSVQNDSDIAGMDPKDVIRALISKATKEKNADLAWAYLMEGYQRGLSQGDLVSALVALNSMAAYDVDSAAMSKERVKAVRGIINRVSGKERMAILQQLPQILQNAIFQDDYAAVLELSKQYGAQLSKQPGARDALKGLMDRAKTLKKSYDSLEPVREKLQENPNDPEANQAMGEFYCFEKDDWQWGLRNFQRGADTRLSQLSVKMLERSDFRGIAEEWLRYAQENPSKKGKALAMSLLYFQRSAARVSAQEYPSLERKMNSSVFAGVKPASVFVVEGIVSPHDFIAKQDLLHDLDTSKGALKGQWSKVVSREGEALVGVPDPAQNQHSLFALPCPQSPSGIYSSEVQRIQGGNDMVSIAYQLPVHAGVGGKLHLLFDVGWGKSSLVSATNTQYSGATKCSLKDGKSLQVKTGYSVDGDNVYFVVECNGRFYHEASMPMSKMQSPYDENFPDEQRVGFKPACVLHARNCTVRFSALSFEMPSRE